MKPFKSLTIEENKALLNISLLSAWANDKLDEAEKNAAIKLSHTATFYTRIDR